MWHASNFDDQRMQWCRVTDTVELSVLVTLHLARPMPFTGAPGCVRHRSAQVCKLWTGGSIRSASQQCEVSKYSCVAVCSMCG